MKRIIIVVLAMLVCSVCYAAQKYNPFTNTWETVPDNWKVKYNTMNNTHSYQPPNAKTEYNAFNNSWDWDSGHGNNNQKSTFGK